jgi:hypothetical protein
MMLHFRGDCRNFDPMHLVGPTWLGDMLKPVDAQYHRLNDMTTIRFEALRRELWPPEATMLAAQVIQKRQVRLLVLAKAGHRDSIDRMVKGEWGHARSNDTQTPKPDDDDRLRLDYQSKRNQSGRVRHRRKGH